MFVLYCCKDNNNSCKIQAFGLQLKMNGLKHRISAFKSPLTGVSEDEDKPRKIIIG